MMARRAHEASDTPRTLVEAALEHERYVIAILLLVIPAASWTWIVMMARDMYGGMDGAAAWMMTPEWTPLHVMLLAVMWTVMMIAMMLPSAAPLVLLYAGALRARHVDHVGRQVYALAGGYVLVWTAFALFATALQRALASWLVLTPMMEPASPGIAAPLLVIAAAYQFTPLKAACLRACRSPLAFILQHSRPGIRGALRLGLTHGAYCLGCCFALMLLLFAGGVMNLAVIVALTLWVLIEKFAPFGAYTPKVSAVGLLALAAWMLLHGSA